jgi:cell division protease FtsH
LLDQTYNDAKALLETHRDQLDRLFGELLKHEALDGETFYRLIGKKRPAVPAAEPQAVA